MSQFVVTDEGTYGDIVDAFDLDPETAGVFYKIMDKAEDERKVALFRVLKPGEIVYVLEEDTPTEDDCAKHGIVAVVAPECVMRGGDA